MKYKIWLAGEDKANAIVNELKGKAVIIEQDDNMFGIEIDIDSSVVLVQLFYAGLFCGMDKVKAIQ
jgi:hypothetical protein